MNRKFRWHSEQTFQLYKVNFTIVQSIGVINWECNFTVFLAFVYRNWIEIMTFLERAKYVWEKQIDANNNTQKNHCHSYTMAFEARTSDVFRRFACYTHSHTHIHTIVQCYRFHLLMLLLLRLTMMYPAWEKKKICFVFTCYRTNIKCLCTLVVIYKYFFSNWSSCSVCTSITCLILNYLSLNHSLSQSVW